MTAHIHEARDAAADEAPLHAHAPMLRRYLFVLGARADRLDDLCQETLAVALEKDIARRRDVPTSAWLRAVAKNLLMRSWQAANRRREVELADEVWREEHDGLDDAARVRALRECVDGLPAKGRAMLQRAYDRGLGRAAIGDEFGMRAAGVKTALRRLRDGLRRCIERRLRGTR